VPIVVRCSCCGLEITLNEDSELTRARRTDPHQQMRRHLLSHLTRDLTWSIRHGRRIGWLIDAMAFTPVTESTRWRNHLIHLVDYFQAPPVEEKGE